jgi:competence protein CoiA
LQFALLNGERVTAIPGASANCPACGAVMLPKCGPRVMHHWAHGGRRNCDPWWENETEWHREWKDLFPIECREVMHVAPDGEIHRADIKTPTGIYIEVQHSPMSDIERISRERFYENLVWIVDGRRFSSSFQLHHLLPDPISAMASDLVWLPAQPGMEGANAGVFWRRSENPEVVEGCGSMVLIHSFRDIKNEVMANFLGHQQYTWTRPHKTWLSANCPVYLDFGDEWLFRLEQYGGSALRCVLRVAKHKFLLDVMTETRAEDIATRFYPVNSQH